MSVSIIIFYGCLIGIISMVLLKRREVNSGRPSVVSRFGERTDSICQNSYAAFRRALAQVNKRNLIAVVQWLAYHVLLHTRKVYVEVKHQALQNPHSKKVIDAVRGRAEVKNHGASFYLRQIGEK
jgi:hypothetical protein